MKQKQPNGLDSIRWQFFRKIQQDHCGDKTEISVSQP